MHDFDLFHDGAFEGLLIDDKTVQLFLSTYQKERFVLVAGGVVALTVNGIQLGNIILDVEQRTSEALTLRDIHDVFDYGKTADGEKHSAKALLMAQREGLCLLALNPSYGGSCLLLAKETELLPYAAWASRQLVSTAG